MVATFNGWDDMAEAERESLEQWELENQGRSSAWALRTRFWPTPLLTPLISGRISKISQPAVS